MGTKKELEEQILKLNKKNNNLRSWLWLLILKTPYQHVNWTLNELNGVPENPEDWLKVVLDDNGLDIEMVDPDPEEKK